ISVALNLHLRALWPGKRGPCWTDCSIRVDLVLPNCWVMGRLLCQLACTNHRLPLHDLSAHVFEIAFDRQADRSVFSFSRALSRASLDMDPSRHSLTHLRDFALPRNRHDRSRKISD